MRWVYILRCEDDYYYVGETSRLYRRFWEHLRGGGGINTYTHPPEEIVAIYNVDTLGKFFEYNSNVIDTINNNYTIYNQSGYDIFLLKKFNNDVIYEYDNLKAENNITECLMTHKKDEWNKIRGGKYTRFDVKYKYPNNNYVKDLPLCKCGLPCDIKKNEDKNYLYFRCAKKNMWEDFKDIFDIDEEPCNFYMEYTTDKELKIQENNKFQERKNALKELFKKGFWLENVEIDDDDEPYQCVGGCKRRSPSIKLTYHNEKRNLCFDCFIDKNEELSKKYNFIGGGKCLLKIK